VEVYWLIEEIREEYIPGKSPTPLVTEASALLVASETADRSKVESPVPTRFVRVPPGRTML